MGFSISWVGVRGVAKDLVLGAAGLIDLGVEDEANEAPFSLAELPTGWAIIFANDFEFAQPDRLVSLPSEALLVGCQVEEHVMFSKAWGAMGAKTSWTVEHYSERGIYDSQVSGAAPPRYDAILRELISAQDQAGGQAADVDYLFDAPVELAESLTGYRHDRWKFDWGEPRFTALTPAP